MSDSCDQKADKEKARSDLSSETFNKAKLHVRQTRLKTTLNGDDRLTLAPPINQKIPEKLNLSREKRVIRNNGMVYGKPETSLSRNGVKEQSRAQAKPMPPPIVSRNQHHNSGLKIRFFNYFHVC